MILQQDPSMLRERLRKGVMIETTYERWLAVFTGKVVIEEGGYR